MFNKHLDQFTKFDGQVYDFREIGLGVVCVSKNITADDDLTHQGAIRGIHDVKVQSLYNWISRYDAVLFAHGDEMLNEESIASYKQIVDQQMENLKAWEKHKRLNKSPDMAKHIDSTIAEIKQMIVEYTEKIKTEKGKIPDEEFYWRIEDTLSPNGQGPYYKTEDWLREAIKEGFKKINVLSCNPGHHDLPDDLKNNKHVMIRISTASTAM
jgi:hypothetical protein